MKKNGRTRESSQAYDKKDYTIIYGKYYIKKFPFCIYHRRTLILKKGIAETMLPWTINISGNLSVHGRLSDEARTMENEEIIGNLTTLIKIIIVTFAPAEIVGMYDPNALAMAIAMIIGFMFALIDAKYPNTFKWLKGKDEKKMEPVMEQVLNDEYET